MHSHPQDFSWVSQHTPPPSPWWPHPHSRPDQWPYSSVLTDCYWCPIQTVVSRAIIFTNDILITHPPPCRARTVGPERLILGRIYLQGYPRLSSLWPTQLADFEVSAKSHCKGAPAKNAILWTCKLTPHARRVKIGPNRPGFLPHEGKQKEWVRRRKIRVCEYF